MIERKYEVTPLFRDLLRALVNTMLADKTRIGETWRVLDRNFDTYRLPRFSAGPRIEAALIEGVPMTPGCIPAVISAAQVRRAG